VYVGVEVGGEKKSREEKIWCERRLEISSGILGKRRSEEV
jgi:hypothetical protein